MQAGRRRVRMMILLLLLLAGLGAALLLAHLDAGPEPAAQALAGAGQAPFVAVAYGQDGTQPVRLWQDEGGSYHLFLPCWAQAGRLELIPAPGQGLHIGELAVGADGFYELAPGSYPMQWGGQTARLVVHQAPADLPTVQISTGGEGLAYVLEDKAHRVPGSLLIFDEQGRRIHREKIKTFGGRGNTSWKDPAKKSYRLTLERRADLLGMGEAKKWLLMANALDPTQMRNEVVFSLAREAGMAYVTDTRYAELFIDGQYQGVYQLCEKIEIDPSRIAVTDLEALNEQMNPELDFLSLKQKLTGAWDSNYSSVWFELPDEPQDASGGFLLELDLPERRGDSASNFKTARGQAVGIKSPKYVTQRQSDFIRLLWQRLENGIYSPEGFDPDTGIRWEELADVPSFAQKFLVEELTKNVDAVKTSQYFYKSDDRDDPMLYAGPPWDYDYALNSQYYIVTGNYPEVAQPEGLYLAEGEGIWPALYQHESFRQEVQRQFFANFLPGIRFETETGIAQRAQWLLPHVQMDAARWGTWPAEQSEAAYREQVAILRDFLAARADWLSTQWQAPQA